MNEQPDDVFRPKIDPARSEAVKPADVREEQIARSKERLAARGDTPGRANPIVSDETYGALREDNRVVMRHTIALNIDNFRASSEEFDPRPARTFPALHESVPPFFSVVVANYSGQRHLPVVLGALRQQTFRDFEVILADDASTDDSVALVERRFPEVRLLVNRRNEGFAATCNSGAAAASGRMIVMLNSDTEPEPTWLETMARAIVAHPETGCFASKMLLFDKRDTLHTAGDALGVDGLARNRGARQRDAGQFDADENVFSACGGAAVYRGEVWEALGGFDEGLWMYLEDVDFGFRARLAGWSTTFVPQARVYHHLSASGGDTLASYYVGRNAIWVIARNMPAGLLRRHLAQIVGAQVRLAWDAARSIRGEAARARLLGMAAGLLGLPRQLSARRAIQRRAVADESAIELLLVRDE